MTKIQCYTTEKQLTNWIKWIEGYRDFVLECSEQWLSDVPSSVDNDYIQRVIEKKGYIGDEGTTSLDQDRIPIGSDAITIGGGEGHTLYDVYDKDYYDLLKRIQDLD